jgi:methylglutaconyl-CoA hydratase
MTDATALSEVAELPAGLTIDRHAGVAVATIDRPPRNLLSAGICRALTSVLDDPGPDVHILHLRAAGASFCLGRERGADDPAALRDEVDALVGLNQALTRSSVVTVAEVQGDAAGFGVGLAALCDVTVAARSARFWFPEVEIDLAPAVVLTWLAPVVGRKRAFHLTATASRLTAADAERLGLVTEVVDPAELSTATERVIDLLRSFSPHVHARIKQFLDITNTMDEDQAYALATERLILGSMQRRRGPDEI